MKEYYPVQLCEYDIESRISDESMFPWLLPYVINENTSSQRSNQNTGFLHINLILECLKVFKKQQPLIWKIATPFSEIQ